MDGVAEVRGGCTSRTTRNANATTRTKFSFSFENVIPAIKSSRPRHATPRPLPSHFPRARTAGRDAARRERGRVVVVAGAGAGRARRGARVDIARREALEEEAPRRDRGGRVRVDRSRGALAEGSVASRLERGRARIRARDVQRAEARRGASRSRPRGVRRRRVRRGAVARHRARGSGGRVADRGSRRRSRRRRRRPTPRGSEPVAARVQVRPRGGLRRALRRLRGHRARENGADVLAVSHRRRRRRRRRRHSGNQRRLPSRRRHRVLPRRARRREGDAQGETRLRYVVDVQARRRVRAARVRGGGDDGRTDGRTDALDGRRGEVVSLL